MTPSTHRRLVAIETSLKGVEKLQDALLKSQGLAVRASRTIMRDLEDRLSRVESALSEMKGTSPGMWTQVDMLRSDLDHLVALTGNRKRRVPFTSAVPAHFIIEKIPKGNKD